MEDLVVRSRAMAAAAEAGQAFSTEELQKSLRRPRTLLSFLCTTLTASLTLVALAPLFSVVYMLVVRGLHRLNWESLTALPPLALEEGGGFGNAIVGTLIMVGLAGLLSVPFGILAAVFLAEIGPETRLAQVVRFGAKMLSGFPSILAGVLAYGVLVRGFGWSAYAGAVALSVLMLPTVMLTAEDAIRMVPAKIREAAIGMGATRTQVIWYVLLPTATPGILTGVMLAIARAAGETAPLLFTALFCNSWNFDAHDHFNLSQNTASLAVLIYKFSGSSYDNQVEVAWAAALVLVLLVLTFNLIGQALSPRNR